MSLVDKIVAVVETIGADIKALYTGKVDKADITQEIGSDPDKVMSQKAVREAFVAQGSGIAGLIETKVDKAAIAQVTGYDPNKVMSQKAITEVLDNIPSGSTINVVQEKGNSTTDVMSQEAVTINMDSLGVDIDLLRQELNNLKDRLPPAIGDERWGGFYIGDITIPSGDDAGTYMVIMAGKEGEAQEKWKLAGTNTTGTNDRNNGKRNTLGMVNAGISEHPAGEYCVNYRGGGFDDWYMPAINEAALAWDNRALLGDLKTGTLTLWSSTQSATTQARTFDFYREKEDISSKTTDDRVRPVRRIKKS